MKLPTRMAGQVPAITLAICGAGCLLDAQLALGLSPNNVPQISSAAKDVGRTDPNRKMNLTIVLNLHDQAGLDKVVGDLYDRNSPNFRRWLTSEDLAHYAPTADEFAAVKAALVSQGYQVLSESPNRTSIRVSGTAAITEQAFNTELHDLQYGSKRVFAHIKDAAMTGYAGTLIHAVSGLDEHKVRPLRVDAHKPNTNQPIFQYPVAQVTSSSILSMVTDIALGLAPTTAFATNGANPTLSVTGLTYDPSGLVVAFTPQQLQEYYGLNDLYSKGYHGEGQTVAVLEAYGYQQAMDDANAFSTLFNLPPLTAQTFEAIYPNWNGPNTSAAESVGWSGEIALDIDAVHSIAPAAKIVEVAVGGQDNEDFVAGIQYIIDKDVAKIISDSWEVDTDLDAGPLELSAYDTVLELGAARGFAFQFSTGDHGDVNYATGGPVGSPVGAAGIPSESPYATAVGGTTVLNDPAGSGFVATGWGDSTSFPVLLTPSRPPYLSVLLFGAGGGISIHEPKPRWQSGLPYDHRAVPDVAALADPFTGAFAVETLSDGVQYVAAGAGGTSLASPLVSAIWAIANQYGEQQNGGKQHGAKRSLGQIAPVVAQLAPGQITDVRATSSLTPNSLTGVYTDVNGKQTNLAPPDFFSTIIEEPLQKDFICVSWLPASTGLPGILFVIGFGADGVLHVTDGWDDVTGYGEPKGLPFIEGVQ